MTAEQRTQRLVSILAEGDASPPSTEPIPGSHAALLTERVSQLDAGAVRLESGADVRARLAMRARDNLVGAESRRRGLGLFAWVRALASGGDR